MLVDTVGVVKLILGMTPTQVADCKRFKQVRLSETCSRLDPDTVCVNL